MKADQDLIPVSASPPGKDAVSTSNPMASLGSPKPLPFSSPLRSMTMTSRGTPSSIPGSGWKTIMSKQSPGGKLSITREVAKIHRDMLMEVCMVWPLSVLY